MPINLVTPASASYFASERDFPIGGHCKMFARNINLGIYATGGQPLTGPALGFGPKACLVQVNPCFTDSGTYVVMPKRVDIYTINLVVLVFATMAQVTNATDLSAELLTLSGTYRQ